MSIRGKSWASEVLAPAIVIEKYNEEKFAHVHWRKVVCEASAVVPVITTWNIPPMCSEERWYRRRQSGLEPHIYNLPMIARICHLHRHYLMICVRWLAWIAQVSAKEHFQQWFWYRSAHTARHTLYWHKIFLCSGAQIDTKNVTNDNFHIVNTFTI